MSYTVEELVEYLRVNLLDDVADFGIDWKDIENDEVTSYQLLWTNEQLVSYIAEAQNQVCRRVYPIKDSITISLTADTSEYTLDNKVLKIHHAILSSNGRLLQVAEMKDVENIQNWESLTGVPTHYLKDYKTGYFRPYVTPSANDSVKLYVYRLPTQTLSWTDSCDTLEIKQYHQIPMLHYAAYLAYMKQDVDTFDENKAIKYLSLFNNEFPETSVYSDIRKSRSHHRTVRYGGI